MDPKLSGLSHGPAKARDSTEQRPPCFFFARGVCRNGTGCSFSHNIEQKDARARAPCRFHLQGSCLKGSTCPFSHEADALAVTAEGIAVSSEADTENPDSCVRAMHGAVVHFGDGATVEKASLQSDFSAVRLSMLPPETTRSNVYKLLATIGFAITTENIRITLRAGGRIADMRVQDPTFATRICDVIKTMNSSSASAWPSSIKATVINVTMPQVLSAPSVECNKVHCSWDRPTTTVWASFRSHRAAQAIHDRFASGQSTVCDQTVTTHAVQGPTPWSIDPHTFTVMLTEVPAHATCADVVQTFPHLISPMHVEIGRPTYDCDMRTANDMIKTKMMDVGVLDWWENATLEGKQVQVRGRFRDDGDAARVAAELNGWELPFSNKIKLNIQAIYTARFKILDRVYKILKPAIDVQCPIWQANHVFLTVHDASEPSRLRVLELEGGNNTMVGEAKQSLDGIVAGEVAVDEKDNPIWTPAFTVNGDLFRKIQSLEQNLGVVIVRDKRMSRLRLFGPPDACRQAKKHLAKMATDGSSISKAIRLDDEKKFVTWACQGGFKEITKVLGSKVALDIVSTPKRIIITGTEKDYRVALGMVMAQNEPSSTKGPESDAECLDCSICLTEAENSIQTSCGHTYCGDCFEQFCLVRAAMGNADCKLTCEGNSSKCETVLKLAELEDVLPSRTFEEVLENSVETYLRRRPDVFGFCPKPDCPQIYRITDGSEGTVLTCPNCLTAICTQCNVSHPEMTCAEHKDISSGGNAALEEAKKLLGIRDCPKCKIPIEKSAGCDHVACPGCGTHICWMCMKTFETSDSCYQHLDVIHVGEFDIAG